MKNIKAPREVKEKALVHYDKLIAFAETLKSDKRTPEARIFQTELGFSYKGINCPFCNYYLYSNAPWSSRKDCIKCPLNSVVKGKNTCCNTLWIKMAYASTFKEWLQYAYKIRKMIEKIEVSNDKS